ncbi:unnamed protein product [Fusarium equiseti]|uniref:Uncharacterized protein n=1 Tax=Fusarium equiseti TaxID=61235 RepID=A0A8J2NFG8_FUSEQ|nr:unnamed protein product [Fusarium equiseti]
MAVSNIDKIVGPIIATVPIRVRVPSGKNSKTILAFLRGVQDAAAAVILFEQAGLQYMQNSQRQNEQVADGVENAVKPPHYGYVRDALRINFWVPDAVKRNAHNQDEDTDAAGPEYNQYHCSDAVAPQLGGG